MFKLLLQFAVEGISAFLLLSVILLFDELVMIPIAICIISGLVLYYLHPTKADLIGAILASFIGPLADILSSYYGSWSFANDQFFGIPAWLPVSWAVNFLLFRRLSQTIYDLLHITKP